MRLFGLATPKTRSSVLKSSRRWETVSFKGGSAGCTGLRHLSGTALDSLTLFPRCATDVEGPTAKITNAVYFDVVFEDADAVRQFDRFALGR